MYSHTIVTVELLNSFFKILELGIIRSTLSASVSWGANLDKLY